MGRSSHSPVMQGTGRRDRLKEGRSNSSSGAQLQEEPGRYIRENFVFQQRQPCLLRLAHILAQLMPSYEGGPTSQHTEGTQHEMMSWPKACAILPHSRVACKRSSAQSTGKAQMMMVCKWGKSCQRHLSIWYNAEKT